MKDVNFVPVIVTHPNGVKETAYFYKPQNLLIAYIASAEDLKSLGFTIEEIEEENNV